MSGLLGAGFGQFGCQEKLKQNPLQHLFEVSMHVWKVKERVSVPLCFLTVFVVCANIFVYTVDLICLCLAGLCSSEQGSRAQ